MVAMFLMLLWQGRGILVRPSSKTLAESLYQKDVSGYHHLQCPAAGLLVVLVSLIHLA